MDSDNTQNIIKVSDSANKEVSEEYWKYLFQISDEAEGTQNMQ